jgi:hypothetical protein
LLKKESVAAFNYLDLIPHKTWATYAFPFSRFGHLTSNISESVNNMWKEIRYLPILKMVDTIWSTMMKTIYKRYNEIQKNSILCDIPYTKFQKRLKDSQRYQVSASRINLFQVQIPETDIKYIVNLKENSCSCNNFFQYRGPCSHAIAACRYQIEDPFDYFDTVYFVRKFRKTYEVPMTPVSTENLVPSMDLNPPKLIRKRGRPQKKRIRKSSWNKKEVKCGNCFGFGHNKRSCTNQPGRKNGRGERARDWALDSSSESREGVEDTSFDISSDISEDTPAEDTPVEDMLVEGIPAEDISVENALEDAQIREPPVKVLPQRQRKRPKRYLD